MKKMNPPQVLLMTLCLLGTIYGTLGMSAVVCDVCQTNSQYTQTYYPGTNQRVVSSNPVVTYTTQNRVVSNPSTSSSSVVVPSGQNVITTHYISQREDNKNTINTNSKDTVVCDVCQTNSQYTQTYYPGTNQRVVSSNPVVTYTTHNRVINNPSTSSSVVAPNSQGVITTHYISQKDDNKNTVESNSQGCSTSPCGVNALCQETLGGRPVCSCPPGHSGNPLTYCRRAECLDHTECAFHLSCRGGNCVDPCAGTCGSNANCEVRNHVAVCSCPKGFKGDPFSYCSRIDPEEQCHPSPCGQNTNCEVINGTPTCSCIKGYIGNPLAGCRHECESDYECGAQEYCKDFKCLSACSQCGTGASCARVTNHRAVCDCPKGYIGSAYGECRPECYGDRDCPAGRPACFYGICKNPCDTACGVGADCNLRGLTPICSCPRDMTGDPFVSCRPFVPADLCNPNPCGQNAQCVPGHDNTGKERPVCSCLPGYTGNSLSYCVRGECQSDAECPDHRACLNYQCVDPCVGQCGANAVCEPKRHLAVCKCPQGTTGDALTYCRQSRTFPVPKFFKKK